MQQKSKVFFFNCSKNYFHFREKVSVRLQNMRLNPRSDIIPHVIPSATSGLRSCRSRLAKMSQPVASRRKVTRCKNTVLLL